MPDLSIIIPARNEEFLRRTIESILKNARGDTEVIAIFDGYWPDPPIDDDERVRIIHNTEPIGQRQATNQGAKLSRAKYIMKCDGHCHFDEGFDVKLMADCEYDWTVVPRMFVLDAFHWVCPECSKEYHQGPVMSKCRECGFEGELDRKIVWEPKAAKKTDYMWFDNTMRVRYFDRNHMDGFDKKTYYHKYRDWAKEPVTDVMCGVGACWFLHRDRYWELGGMDESHGSWGQMGVEVACKAWLSGGRHVVNKNTWFSHLFRTQKGFTWPYDNPMKAQDAAREYSRDLWLNDKWSGQKRKLEWLIDKFAPLKGWDSGS